MNKVRPLCNLFAIAMIIAPLSAQKYEKQVLTASNGLPGDELGLPIAIDGDLAIIGAWRDDDHGQDSGAAYIFRYQPHLDQWVQEAHLLGADPSAGDRFGHVVDIAGDVAVVGAYRNDTNGSNSGAAYVFRYDHNNDNWFQEGAPLLPPPGTSPEADDEFGRSVSVSGSRIAVGATRGGSNDEGAVFLFEYVLNTWAFRWELTASDGKSGDQFGYSVDLKGDLLAVGARLDDDQASNAGSIYALRRNLVTGTWFEEAELYALDGGANDQLGRSVATTGNIIVAGAPYHSIPYYRTGAAYTFQYSNNGWGNGPKLSPINGEANDLFAKDVGITDGFIIAGAENGHGAQSDSGAAYVYQQSGSDWNLYAHLLSTSGSADGVYGNRVAIFDDIVMVGDRFSDPGGQIDAGSVYVHDLFTLWVDPTALEENKYATFTTQHGLPFTNTYLAYSTQGIGSTSIPFLGVTANLLSPVTNLPVRQSDANGSSLWSLLIPSGTSGISVWLQAAQFGRTTNVVATTIH